MFPKDFTAKIGGKAAAEDIRKFCQFTLNLAYSPGFSFAIYSADVAGYADLDPGVSGTVKSRYYISGETDEVCNDPNRKVNIANFRQGLH